MTFPAKVVKQLPDPPWGPYNCWDASVRGMIAFASDGKVRVDADTVRKRAGKWVGNPSHETLERIGPGNFPDMRAAIRHPDTVAEFRAAGLKPPKVRILGAAKMATLKHYLVKGYQVAIAIDYGVVLDRKPAISGSETFRGFHSVRLYGAYDERGNQRTALGLPFFTDQLDPLCDGRRPGIAKGPQRVNGKFVVLASAPVSGVKGRVLAMVVKPAERIAPHDPEPPDKPPTDDPKTDCAAALVAEQATTARLRAAIRAVQAALTDVPAAMNTIAAIVNDPENAEEVEG